MGIQVLLQGSNQLSHQTVKKVTNLILNISYSIIISYSYLLFINVVMSKRQPPPKPKSKAGKAFDIYNI